MGKLLEQLKRELAVAEKSRDAGPPVHMGIRQKHDATGTPTYGYWYGPGSIFGVGAVLDRALFSTKLSVDGLADMIPARGVKHVQHILPYYTGQTASTGSDPGAMCRHCRVAGQAKSCFLRPVMGRLCVDSQEVQITRAGQMLHQYDGLLQLQNPPLIEGSFTAPPLATQRGALGGLTNEVDGALMAVGNEFQQWIGRGVYTFNPVNNVGTGTLFTNGLDLQITTGITDAQTGIACPALDSTIQNFNYNQACPDGGPVAGFDIVDWIIWMYRKLRMDGLAMKLSGLSHVISMRPELFSALADCWPCEYMTYRCQPWQPAGGFGAQGHPVNLGGVTGTEAVAMRDAMKQGSYLLIDGFRIPVVQDFGVVQYNGVVGDTWYDALLNPGQFMSDIYFIPMSFDGGALLEWMYLDFAQTDEGWQLPGGLSPLFYTDGGRFMWDVSQTRKCVIFSSEIWPILVLRAPFVAGKIDNVMYVPHKMPRSPYDDEYYFVDGGTSGARTFPW